MLDKQVLILAFTATALGLADWCKSHDPLSLALSLLVTGLVFCAVNNDYIG